MDEPLPSRVRAIQASAGTGKTFTLVGLAVRFIAEQNVAASELLMVTFTRAATNELRSRVRERLVQAAAALAGEDRPDDELFAYLAQDHRTERLGRIRRAISDFDSATITTIHGFATQMLGVLGTTAESDPDAALVDDAGVLLGDCCVDVLARAAAEGIPKSDLPSLTELVNATGRVMACPDTDVIPTSDHASDFPKYVQTAELVDQVRQLVSQRRRQGGTLGYDDLLTELQRALRGPGSAAAVGTIRDRYSVALIDEFQDTDPVQWDIFDRLFAQQVSATAMVLVGDPKQAIFAFRGANVHTFLDALATPGLEQRALARNWRSNGAVIHSLDTFFNGATFGESSIRFEKVVGAPINDKKRLANAYGPLPALSLRLALGPSIERNSPSRARAASDTAMVAAPAARRAIYADLVASVRELLMSATFRQDDDDRVGTPVEPSDIAVLVRSGVEATAVQRALIAQGVPAVLSRGNSVLETPAADQWRLLVSALVRPSDPDRARAFALSWFMGWSAREIDEADEAALALLHEQLARWADILASHGVAPFVRRVMADSLVVARLLHQDEGDRRVTDLEHIGELLHALSPPRPSATGLSALLIHEPEGEADADTNNDVTARRIESDDEAVKVMTVWVAKGLEFPIVCVPTMWSMRTGIDVLYQDPETHRRTFDVAKGKDWPDKAAASERKSLAAREALGEHLRLLYVALTRAEHHTMVWWARTDSDDRSSLAHLLFARRDGAIDDELFLREQVPSLPSDADAEAFLEPLVRASDGTIAVEIVDALSPPGDRWASSQETPTPPLLDVAHLTHRPDRTRKRWSFTALTRGDEADANPNDASMADRGAGDEPGSVDQSLAAADVIEGTRADDASITAATGPVPAMALLPAGPAFGTLVHAVLEGVDFATADLDRVVRRRLNDVLSRYPVDLASPMLPDDRDGEDVLVEALRQAITSPLGAPFTGSLADIGPGDRLNELSFVLSLGGGGHRPTTAAIGALVADHLPVDDAFGPWARQVATGGSTLSLAGHLTGSIDAVIRVRAQDGSPRFVVVDYKTNRLSTPRQLPGPDDYGPARIAEAMVEHHYPLQALLYSVALHRYLRSRLGADYHPERHLGGAAYLFVRGMAGPDVRQEDGRPQGVCHWDIPPVLVDALSDLLHGWDTTRGEVR
jgi:exodeoxyribonuclease V beta subunit